MVPVRWVWTGAEPSKILVLKWRSAQARKDSWKVMHLLTGRRLQNRGAATNNKEIRELFMLEGTVGRLLDLASFLPWTADRLNIKTMLQVALYLQREQKKQIKKWNFAVQKGVSPYYVCNLGVSLKQGVVTGCCGFLSETSLPEHKMWRLQWKQPSGERAGDLVGAVSLRLARFWAFTACKHDTSSFLEY